MVVEIVTSSGTLNSATELAIVPIAELVAPITVTLPEGVEGQEVWVKAIGPAGDMNVSLAVTSPDTLEVDTGLDVLNSHGASRLMYFTDGQWLFLTYM